MNWLGGSAAIIRDRAARNIVRRPLAPPDQSHHHHRRRHSSHERSYQHQQEKQRQHPQRSQSMSRLTGSNQDRDQRPPAHHSSSSSSSRHRTQHYQSEWGGDERVEDEKEAYEEEERHRRRRAAAAAAATLLQPTAHLPSPADLQRSTPKVRPGDEHKSPLIHSRTVDPSMPRTSSHRRSSRDEPMPQSTSRLPSPRILNHQFRNTVPSSLPHMKATSSPGSNGSLDLMQIPSDEKEKRARKLTQELPTRQRYFSADPIGTKMKEKRHHHHRRRSKSVEKEETRYQKKQRARHQASSSHHKRKRAHSLSPSARPSKRSQYEVAEADSASRSAMKSSTAGTLPLPPPHTSTSIPLAVPATSSHPSNQLARIQRASERTERHAMDVLNQSTMLPLEREMIDVTQDEEEEEFDPHVEYKSVPLTPIKAVSISLSGTSSYIRERVLISVATMKGFSLVDSPDLGCSHLLLENPIRTLKLLYAIARGSWVLSPAWMIASLDRRRWLAEELFENTTFVGCRISRITKAQKGPTLFRGLHVLVTSPTNSDSSGSSNAAPPQCVLEELLYLTGANIVVHPEDASVIVSYSLLSWSYYVQQLSERNATGGQEGGFVLPAHIPLVTPTWIYECLTRYLVMPPSAYQLGHTESGSAATPTSPQL